ncbi:hypothetical protein Tco_0371453 [Tanacetum coccineum]
MWAINTLQLHRALNAIIQLKRIYEVSKLDLRICVITGHSHRRVAESNMVTPSSGSRLIDRTHCIDAVPDHVPSPMLIQQSTSIDIAKKIITPHFINNTCAAHVCQQISEKAKQHERIGVAFDVIWCRYRVTWSLSTWTAKIIKRSMYFTLQKKRNSAAAMITIRLLYSSCGYMMVLLCIAGVDLRLARVCQLGLLNYKAKHVYYPFEKRNSAAAMITIGLLYLSFVIAKLTTIVPGL